MNNLNNVLSEYLKTNGIKAAKLAEYLGLDESACYKWLHGTRKLPKDQMTKALQFLSGDWLRGVDVKISEK